MANTLDELRKKILNFANYTVPQTAARFASNPQVNRVAQDFNQGMQNVSNFATQARIRRQQIPTKQYFLPTAQGYAPERLRGFVNNMYIQPAKDIPNQLNQIVAPPVGLNIPRVNLKATGRLGLDVLGAVPDPSDIIFTGYNFLKGGLKARREGQPLLQGLDTQMKSLSLERPIGLGEALTKPGRTQTALNMLELPALLFAGFAKNKIQARKAMEMAIKYEKPIMELINSRPNLQKLTQEMQIGYFTNLDKISKQVIPDVVNSKEMKKLSIQDPLKWIDYVTRYLGDALESGKHPENLPLFGFGTKELKRPTQASKRVPTKTFKPTIKTPEDLTKIQAKHERARVSPPILSQQEGREQLTKAVIQEDNPNAFKQSFNKWIGQRDVAITTGAEAGMKFRDIPKSKAEEFINHAEGVELSKDPEIIVKATRWKQATDALYTDLQSVAKREGVDLGYIDQYVTHFWKESPEQVQQIMSAKGRSFGQRKVPTYKEGIDMGLTPKYKNPAEIMSEYVAKIEKTKANIGLFKEMKDRGMVVPASVGRNTPGFSPIHAPGFPRSTTSYQGKVFDGSYYAPNTIAREINRMFSPQDFGKTGIILSRTAKLSKGAQDIVLSGGAPGTPLNAFTAAQALKEFTSGSFARPIKAFAKSLSPSVSLEYFEKNAGQIKKMQSRNVTVRSSFDTQGLKGGGNLWDKLISDATFKRFMPTLQIELFNKIEKQALGMGKKSGEAADIAAKAVQNFYGLTNTGDMARRSQLGKDITSTFAFAPTYRESMINFWVKSLKAIPGFWKLENRQNIKFLIGAVATYGVMNHLNTVLNGHPMSQNPQGKEDKLLIPAGDTTIGVPFLSSIATVPRGIYRIAKDALNVDFKAAGADTLRTFGSMLVKPAGEMILNEDYFGQEIYDVNADRLEKGKQIATYLFKSNQHPWLRAALEAKGTPIYQTLSKAAELPFRFYKTSSIANAPFWEKYHEVKALDERFQEMKYKDPNKAVAFYNENKAKLDSLKNLKEQVSAYYETGQDSKILQEGGVIQSDGHMAFTGTDGKFHLIDTNFNIPLPEFTGNELLDKKIKSSYTSKLTSLENNVVTLFENGIITSDQAEEALGGIKELKDAVKAPKKPKAPKKISIKVTKTPSVKITLPKRRSFKIAQPKKIKVSSRRYTIKA